MAFPPGKLSERQRQFILQAGQIYEGGQAGAYCAKNEPDEMASVDRLVARGLMKPGRNFHFFHLTEDGWRTARALHALFDHDFEHMQQVREIDAYLAKLGV